ncbi:MAG: SDR family oxidoreductase [Woeseiaceae bacterium]|nr:SDR family oxidoreductase [Woeseiaceae bacterium]
MKIFVTGACGYKGTVLVPKLLKEGYEVTAFDIMWFGNNLPSHKNLSVIEGDIRRINDYNLNGYDVVIHLSSVANDPCGDLNPKLTWEVSCLATMLLAENASKCGVTQFIYASSGSVYGVKDEEQVTEELELDPISEYNKTKMVSEKVLLSYSDKMAIQIIRPATVCGFSDRMRLDVAVNLLTMQALSKGEITVLGGDQTRPNIHIDDITNVYIHFIKNPQHVGVFNAGFENISILDIANMVSLKTNAKIKIKPSNDPRSYRINSDKLLNTGFKPTKTVEIAIQEMIDLFRDNVLQDKDENYNLKWMEKHKLYNLD